MKALIVIDMLKGYMKDTDHPKRIIKNQIKLIRAFKKRNYKIILAVPDFKSNYENPVMIKLWGKEFEHDPESQQIVPELKQFKFSKIIKKKEYSVFFKTNLEDYCKKNKITELYFTGVYCGCCIFFGAVDAAYRKIQPYMILDATGGPKKSLVGIKWRGETNKRFKLMMGPIIKTKDILGELR
jgi:nicotinamidase-related amidase